MHRETISKYDEFDCVIPRRYKECLDRRYKIEEKRLAKLIKTGRPTAHDPCALGRAFKQRLHSGDVILGGVISETISIALIKIYRQAGFEFIFTDNEHVLFAGLPSMASFVTAARDNHLPIISKTPELERTDVARLLEAGVVGIQLPRTESRQDLETLIDYMKFPPVGTRAAAPLYGNVDYVAPDNLTKWLADANDSTVIVVHIETRRGLENFEEIVTTPHVDMVYIGAVDFSIAMGQPGAWDHPDVRGPMEHMLELCVRHNVPFGTTAATPQAAARWMALGARFFEVVDELSLLAKGATEIVDAYNLASQTVQVVSQHLSQR